MPPVVVTRCRRFMNSPNPSHGNGHGCHGITGANDYNWYQGYTQIQLPYHTILDFSVDVQFDVTTYATSGTISSQHFGDKFAADKVETSIGYKISVKPPFSVEDNDNATLHFDLEKLSLNDLTNGKVSFYLSKVYDINENTKYAYQNYTPPGSSEKYLKLERKVSVEEVRNQKLELMPGFRFSWYYSGVEVEKANKYSDRYETKAFVRNNSISYAFL